MLIAEAKTGKINLVHISVEGKGSALRFAVGGSGRLESNADSIQAVMLELAAPTLTFDLVLAERLNRSEVLRAFQGVVLEHAG